MAFLMMSWAPQAPQTTHQIVFIVRPIFQGVKRRPTKAIYLAPMHESRMNIGSPAHCLRALCVG